LRQTLVKTLKRLVPILGEIEGEPTPLEGGITNRNFRARFGDGEVVIRLPGKDTELLGIDREAERQANACAAEAGVAPEVVASLDDPPCLVTRFVEGREMSPGELREPLALQEVAAALRAVHGCGERLSTSFSPLRVVETYAELATGRGASLPEDYASALQSARRADAALSGPDHDPVLCHNDLLAANFLRGPEGVRIVDWEYAGMGDRFFDLGNFAVNNELDGEDEVALLEAYFGERPGRGRLAALRLMRFMSDFREAMWGVLQGAISDLDFDFDDYAADHFDRLREAAAGKAFEASIEEARAAAG
jgi:thiamine kinase-like enzyme